MAAKRRPTSDLNHENWNAEESPEDAGTFKRAPEDEIKTRIIKTARRRNPIHSVRSEEEKKGAFGSFTGFSKAQPSTTHAFGFLSNLTKAEQPKTNGITDKNDTVSTSSPATAFPIPMPKTIFSSQPNTQTNNEQSNKSNQQTGKSTEYYARLKGLNESVSKWIKQHVDENPFVNLQPIFRDYEKYLEELETNSKKNDESGTSSLKNTKSTTQPKENASSSLASFVFKPLDDTTSNKSTESKKPTWNFGIPSSTSEKPTPGISETPKLSFGTSSIKKSTPEMNKDKEKANTSSSEVPTFSFGIPNASKSPPESNRQDGKSGTCSLETPTFSFGIPSTSKSSPKANKQDEKSGISSSGTPKFGFGVTNSIKSTPESNKHEGKSSTSSVSLSRETTTFSFGNASTSKSSPEHKKQDDKSKTTLSEAAKFSFGSVDTNKSSPESIKKDNAKAKSAVGSVNAKAPAETFKFGSGSSNFAFGSAGSSGFSFPKPSSALPGFTFTNVSKPESSEDAQNDEDEDEPPKVEFTPVVEEGHIYTTKCKIFVKKDKVFGDRGVGNLFLKPVPDSEKTQLIVRADTNLGNLLCNFILSESIPMQRMGKKDVMLVCLPTPDTKPPPVPILLRVKSPEEADKLLEMLQKYKK